MSKKKFILVALGMIGIPSGLCFVLTFFYLTLITNKNDVCTSLPLLLQTSPLLSPFFLTSSLLLSFCLNPPYPQPPPLSLFFFYSTKTLLFSSFASKAWIGKNVQKIPITHKLFCRSFYFVALVKIVLLTDVYKIYTTSFKSLEFLKLTLGTPDMEWQFITQSHPHPK